MSYSQPPREFSNHFRVKPPRRSRNAEDEALVQHVHASLYPFHAQPTNPCFEVQLPSRKIKSYARGTFTTASAVDTWGFVYIAPVFCSNPLSTECGFTVGSPLGHNQFTNVNGFTNINSPLVRTEFSITGQQARMLSCGLRVRNITPMLNRGGTLFALKSPNDAPLPTGVDFNTLIADLEVTGNLHRCDTSGDQWQTLAWSPRDKDQMEFTPNPSSQDFSSGQMLRTLCFIAQAPGAIGVAANAQTYEFEAVFHFDYISVANSNDNVHGSTRGISHPRIDKVQQIIGDLQTKPQIIQNEASASIANFITDIIDAGHGVNEVVNAACDIASKTASVLPSVYRRVRALGSFL